MSVDEISFSGARWHPSFNVSINDEPLYEVSGGDAGKSFAFGCSPQWV